MSTGFEDQPWQATAATAGDMKALAERLGRVMRVGDVVGLVGPLGTGKTTFSQGLAVGLGVDADRHVQSPTFALVNEHPGRVPFIHADFYRVNKESELRELGLEEAYDRAAAALEWADRFPEIIPNDHLTVEIHGSGDTGRQLFVRAHGPRSVALRAAWLGHTA